MKRLPALVASCAVASLLHAASAPTPSSSNTPAVLTLPATDAVLTAPLTLVDGYISLAEKTELPAGGKAAFSFTVAKAGDYLISGQVNAPSESKNSFYVNIDAIPDSAAMIWDFDITHGFEERTVSWRGSGDADWSEFTPKIFKLTAGKHELYLVGREPAQLKSISIIPWKAPITGTIEAIKAHYEETDSRFQREFRKLPDTREGQARADELYSQSRNEHAEEFAAAITLAQEHPKSAEGFAAVEWVLQTPRSYYTPSAGVALKILNEQYATEPTIGETLAVLIRFLPNRHDPLYLPTRSLLNNVLANNSYRNARAQATFGLAQFAQQKYQEHEASGNKAELAKSAADAEQSFEILLKEYGDCPDLSFYKTSSLPRTLGQRATRALREIRQLSIGKTAPDIEGADTDGAPFKLSDYRGKVILLVFWASWCGPCMQAIPHEKELVERFKGRPFVLIGVNGDNTLHDATKAVKKNAIPWRSFWDGTRGSGNSISAEWNIRGWPTIYIIDHAGTIREKYLYGPRLDAFLEKLVAEAEKTPTPRLP